MVIILFLSIIVFIFVWAYLTAFSFGVKFFSSLPTWITTVPIAHRGLHGPDTPENSLFAFEKAKEHGFGIELDVRLTKDNQAVVFHDETLNRLTGERGEIKAFIYEDLFKFFLQGTQQKIPLLKEVLSLINGTVPLYIEIKNDNFFGSDRNLEKAVYEKIRNYKGPISIISFNPFTLKWFKDHAPHILRGQTSASYKKIKNSKNLFWKRIFLRHYLANFLSQPDFLIHNLEDIPCNITLKVLKKGKPLLAYGIYDQETLNLVLSLNINFMFDNIENKLKKSHSSL